MTSTPHPPKLLIANRGEIAIRIAQSAAVRGWSTVAVYAADDQNAPHVRAMDEALPLTGSGPAAYLDIEQIVAAARQSGSQLVHPGYGFLSENAGFAAACEKVGLTFVGPSPAILARLGDKAATRQLADELGIPILAGVDQQVDLETARAFLARHPAGLVIKAVAGGGGRGMRVVQTAEELPRAWQQCQVEARRAFGSDQLYLEQWLPAARHIEIQIAGDGRGSVVHFGERDCSLQRRHQKLIEFAPAPALTPELRARLVAAAVKMGEAVQLNQLATVEFLVGGDGEAAPHNFYLIEVNPRLQVEHTVTEAIFGVDLVDLQLALAQGMTFDALGVSQGAIGEPRGRAVQLRINAETFNDADAGQPLPQAGEITRFEPPTGPGIRVDTYARPGAAVNPAYDSLLAKLVCYTPADAWETLLRLAQTRLAQIVIEGVTTNIDQLQQILTDERVAAGRLTTTLVNEIDFLPGREPKEGLPVDERLITAPGTGTVVGILVRVGEEVAAGQELLLLEAMKMEAVVNAPRPGQIVGVRVQLGEVVTAGQPLLDFEPSDDQGEADQRETAVELDHIRPDLAEVFERQRFWQDEQRPDAVARRHAKGQRTARENVADLCDPGSFVEYGGGIVAAQRSRRPLAELIARTPADGLITGYGSINGAYFSAAQARCWVMAYDYTVLAGTQGALNHKKLDRMVRLIQEDPHPLVLFAEGGGGRPGDVDYLMGASQLDVMSFTEFGRLHGRLPLVAIVAGYCFAGNAALAGSCDVIIATRDSSLGMGGPAMIEGGGLGVYHPREVGPAAVQYANGVIDILVEDEAGAVAAAQQYLSYFQGSLADWTCGEQRALRHLIPANRRRMYDMRQVIERLCDAESVLELRAGYGQGMITALVRIGGRPLGLMANNPHHLGGAIDAAAAGKANRFMRLCSTFGLPILSLVDTPGIMVGPEAEKEGTVRAASEMFVVGAALEVPFMAVFLRKGYGLGAQAMAGGSFHVPRFAVSWPTGEFGPMGLEGAVRLGFRRELEQIDDPAARQAAFEEMVAQAYEQGKALNVASYMEIDAVIDPAETRAWVIGALTV